MQKVFNHKSFNYFFGHLWEVQLTYRNIFAFKFTLRSQQPELFQLFATGVIDTGGKFAAGVVDTGGKLPPVSTTLAKLVAKFAAGVADTGGKFATCVVDTGGAPLLANISANFRKKSKQSKWDTLGLGGN
jgi:hypothetical protein